MSRSFNYSKVNNSKKERKESFRVKPRIAKIVRKRKRKLQKRLAKTAQPAQPAPMLNPGAIEYDVAERNVGMVYVGIGAVLLCSNLVLFLRVVRIFFLGD